MEEWGVTFTGSEISAPSDFVEYYPAKPARERERFPGVCLTQDARAVKVWTLTKADQPGSPTYLMFDITNKDGKTDSVTLFKYQTGTDKGTHYYPLEKKTYEITSFTKGRCSGSAFTS